MWKKMLIVDDDVSVRSRLYEIFFSRGHNITCVPTAKETFFVLMEQRFDLILLDDDLPDGRGIEVVTKIREFDKEVKIVILCEGENSQPTISDKNGLRVEAVVKKDFSSQTMVKTILEILRQEDDEDTGASNLLKESVLVIDDKIEVQKTIEAFLKKKGYKVNVASSGEEALMKIKMEKPQVVFLDFKMPGMDGIMVLRQIKRLDESINVVMLTSVQDEYIMEQATKEGACGYLVKPCDLNKLNKLITEILSI